MKQANVSNLLSIVIVNYNGKDFADRCVQSVITSDTKGLQVIVVDNGSTDDSSRFLGQKYKQINNVFILELEKNHGPAKARNEGAKLATGKYIGFLDNDTVVDKDWANVAIKHFEQDNTLGIIQSKLLLLNEPTKLDYVGEYLAKNGFLVQRAMAGEKDLGQYDQEVEILAAKSAGMFMRKDVFEKINGFDDDYFIYVEESDLGWRNWLAGYRVKYVPDSIVFHEFGSSTLILGKHENDRNAKFHGCKNHIMTLVKNLGFKQLFSVVPIHVILWEGLAFYSLFKGYWRAFLWIHQGIFWNIWHFRKNLAKRKIIQNTRVIDERSLFKIIAKKKPLFYFIRKVSKKQSVGNAEGFIKSK